MDVSRIEAVSPRHIEWRKLTANQIIKYENQGIDVPSQYLQWAKDFLNDVNSAQKDEITYEMANSVTETTDTSQAAEAPVTDDTQPPQEEQKTAAQQKREDMKNSGASLRTQASEFTKDSKEAADATTQSATTIDNTKKNSESEIQSLEDEMQELLSRAQTTKSDIKNEIDTINTGKSDQSTFAKIDKLQKQLEQYGIDGQTNIANTESDLNIYKSTLNNQTGIIFNADDFGNTTIDVGQELLASIGHNFFRFYDYFVGKRAIISGEDAVAISQETANLQVEATSINDGNISTANGYKADVQDVTGVSSSDIPKNKNNSSDDSSSQKSDATNQTAGITETDKAASANLDQVLQAKIRKGEGVNT